MTITTNDVQKIAKLVKLDVDGLEQKLAAMFSETLDYIKVLDEVDTKNTTESYQVTGATNVFQQTDLEAKNNTLVPEKATLNASAKNKNLFETTGVFDR